MRTLFMKFLKDESGATAAEYALLIAIVGAGIAAAATTLGGNISTGLTTAGTCITSKGATC
jgi:pilus assembly protein Flp/PilA